MLQLSRCLFQLTSLQNMNFSILVSDFVSKENTGQNVIYRADMYAAVAEKHAIWYQLNLTHNQIIYTALGILCN